MTNAHVVTYKKLGQTNTFAEYFIRMAHEDDYRTVEIVKFDVGKDIAVLKVNDSSANILPIKIGNSEELTFGDKVYAIGNGSNQGLALTQGIISIPKIIIDYEGIKRQVIQSDLTITSGNSGGALLDERGNLLGITTFRTKDNQGNVIYGIVYSLPIHIVMEYVSG